MTPLEYQHARRLRGTQEEVARLLGTTKTTIWRRENGRVPITRQSWLALLALPERKK
jgi:transcriptional regulator with XRE-family HTH domain